MVRLVLLLCSVVFQSAYSLYAEEIPVVSIRINITETSKDDYVGSSYRRCTISLINGASFTSDIPVQIRNMNLGKGGQVLFSVTGGTSVGSSILFLTLSKNSTFHTFYIKRKSNLYSKIDKDAVLEVIDERSANHHTVLARKAFMVGSSPVPSTTARIEMKINSVSTLDDYITWSPMFCSIRLANYSSFSTPVDILLRNMTNSTGKVHFANSLLLPNSTCSGDSLNLTLPNTGTWVDFYISGNFNYPSKTDKDAVIDIIRPYNNTLYSREAFMVRVRKNANNLSIDERDRFINSLVTLNNTNNEYLNFVDIHSKAGTPEGHSGPAFLPWHRALILNFERELQRIDPAVAVPYWRFDEAAPGVFSLDFMGSKPLTSTDSFADFNVSNPLALWNMAGTTGIRRTSIFENGDNPTTISTIRSEVSTLSLGSNFTLFKGLEGNPHGTSHTLAASKTGDWLRSLSTAVQDPIFFLLHSNVDRLWAKWQWSYNLFDPLDVNSYSQQGEYPDSGIIHIGHYLNDTMWPWNGITGTYTGSGTIYPGERPINAPGGSFPEALSFISAPLVFPQPYQMVDYKNNRISTITNSGLGFCYDDVPFQ